MGNRRVNLSGIFWASDLLNGAKPLPKKRPEPDRGFQQILDKETEKLQKENYHE